MCYMSLDREKIMLLFDILVNIIRYVVLERSANYQNGRQSPVSILNENIVKIDHLYPKNNTEEQHFYSIYGGITCIHLNISNSDVINPINT